MDFLLNTSNPINILIIIIVISIVIFLSKTLKMEWPLMISMVGFIGCLIYHTLFLDGLEKGSELISIIYHCIAFDLIYILILFISYLWVDDIVSKTKNIKSYDDSLNWFWNKL